MQDETRNVLIFLAALLLLVEKCVCSLGWLLWVEGRSVTGLYKEGDRKWSPFCFLTRGGSSVHMRAMGEPCEIFVAKANVKCKAVIYNVQNS